MLRTLKRRSAQQSKDSKNSNTMEAPKTDSMDCKKYRPELAFFPSEIKYEEKSDKIKKLFYLAMNKCDFETLEYLINNQQIDINASFGLDQTPLFLAIQEGNRALIEFFLNHGANPNIKLGKITAIEEVLRTIALEDLKKVDIINLLESKGAETTLEISLEVQSLKEDIENSQSISLFKKAIDL